MLDPFAGCGTAIVEAHRAGRQWIGIDVTYLAIDTIEDYMTDEFGPMNIPVVGRPTTIDEARHLAAMDTIKFEQWVVKGLLGWTPTGGKPVDGEKTFVDDETMAARKAIVEVTTGSSKKHFDAFLHHAGEVEIGVYVTLQKATRGMTGAAKERGTYHSEGWQADFPRVQILTIDDLFAGNLPNLPPAYQRRGRGARLLE